MSFIEFQYDGNLSNPLKNNNPNYYSIKNGIMMGLTLAFTSPVGLMFWLSTFTATIQQETNSKLHSSPFLINYFIILGVLLWGAFVSFLAHLGAKMIDQKKLKIISYISGLILIYFGIKYGIQGFNNVKF